MTIESSTIVCPTCGHKVQRTVQGHAEHLKCDSCGWSQDALIIPGDEVALIPDHSDRVEVFIEWANGRATPKEVMAARRVIASLSQQKVPEVLEAAQRVTRFSLGLHPLPGAIELQERAKLHGVRLVFDREYPSHNP